MASKIQVGEVYQYKIGMGHPHGIGEFRVTHVTDTNIYYDWRGIVDHEPTSPWKPGDTPRVRVEEWIASGSCRVMAPGVDEGQ